MFLVESNPEKEELSRGRVGLIERDSIELNPSFG